MFSKDYPLNLIIIVVPINTLVMRLCVPWLQSQGMDLLALQDTPAPLHPPSFGGWVGDGEVKEWQHFLRAFPLGNTWLSSLSYQLLFPDWISSQHHDQAPHPTLGQVAPGGVIVPECRTLAVRPDCLSSRTACLPVSSRRSTKQELVLATSSCVTLSWSLPFSGPQAIDPSPIPENSKEETVGF